MTIFFARIVKHLDDQINFLLKSWFSRLQCAINIIQIILFNDKGFFQEFCTSFMLLIFFNSIMLEYEYVNSFPKIHRFCHGLTNGIMIKLKFLNKTLKLYNTFIIKVNI